MWESAVSSWPVIPLGIAVGILFLAGAVCIIALLYDSGARDTGRVTQFGLGVLGIGIMCCLGIGIWNVAVSVAQLTVHQNALASSAPMQE